MITSEIHLTLWLLNMPRPKSNQLWFLLLLFPVPAADAQSSVWVRTLKTLLAPQAVVSDAALLFLSVFLCFTQACSNEAVNRAPESTPASIRAAFSGWQYCSVCKKKKKKKVYIIFTVLQFLKFLLLSQHRSNECLNHCHNLINFFCCWYRNISLQCSEIYKQINKRWK